jgi:putative transposase
MPRRSWIGSGGTIFHVMNRSARRAQIFSDGADYGLFERLLAEAVNRRPMRLLAYAIMPNHWHLLLWPEGDTDLSRFMQWLTRVHAQLWHMAHRSVGTGAVYQGPFRAIPIQGDDHLLTVCAYIERNPQRANLVVNASDWRWSSAWTRPARESRPSMTEWPIPRPVDWTAHLNTGSSELREAYLRERIREGLPFGGATWAAEVTARLQLTGRARGAGRPPSADREN